MPETLEPLEVAAATPGILAATAGQLEARAGAAVVQRSVAAVRSGAAAPLAAAPSAAAALWAAAAAMLVLPAAAVPVSISFQAFKVTSAVGPSAPRATSERSVQRAPAASVARLAALLA